MPRFAISVLLCSVFIGGCGDSSQSTIAPLTAVCIEKDRMPPTGAWVCPNDFRVECQGPATVVDTIYVPTPLRDGDPITCDGVEYVLSEVGPFSPGDHEIVVRRRADGGLLEVCRATLTIEDLAPPIGSDRFNEIWPPNHKFHTIRPDDCVALTDNCDANVNAHFTYVASDEPVNDKGDGNDEPDVLIESCGSVQLRSERQGGGNGRVYTLGWQAWDSGGNLAEGACHVVVPHDQSGRSALSDPEAYRIPTSCPPR